MGLTLISSGGHSSSMTEPKMMLQEVSASAVTISLMALTSASVKLLLPVMLYTMPVARSMVDWMSGALVAPAGMHQTAEKGFSSCSQCQKCFAQRHGVLNGQSAAH
jgi:hypothetical protein